MNTDKIPHLSELAGLCRSYEVEELYAFGSAIEGGFDPKRSDFDFLVRFAPCEPVEHAERYFGLLESMQDLLQAPVDLVELGAVTNRRFEESVSASRVCVYAA